VLIGALYNSLVPSEYKTKPDGILRLVIGLANQAADDRREAIKSAPDQALSLFRDFRHAVESLHFEAAGQLAREFFVPQDNGTILIRTLEILVAEDGNEVTELL